MADHIVRDIIQIPHPHPEVAAREADAPSADQLRALIRAVARLEAEKLGIPYRTCRGVAEWRYRRIYGISGIGGTWETLRVVDRWEMAVDLLESLAKLDPQRWQSRAVRYREEV